MLLEKEEYGFMETPDVVLSTQVYFKVRETFGRSYCSLMLTSMPRLEMLALI